MNVVCNVTVCEGVADEVVVFDNSVDASKVMLGVDIPKVGALVWFTVMFDIVVFGIGNVVPTTVLLAV